MNLVQRIVNLYPGNSRELTITPSMTGEVATRQQDQHDINNRIIRYKLHRLKQDMKSWRDSYSDMENVFYPNRLRNQQILLDTVLNGHVAACMTKRKNLTLLKEFELAVGETRNEELTELFRSQWFYDAMNYILDALFYGYSYLNWKEINNNRLTGLQLIKRWNISPDREQVLPFPNSFSGFSLFEQEFIDWSLYVATPSENGVSKCGYGILNKVAPYEIYLRNLLGYNGDYVELFSQPFRQGKTTAREGPERDAFEAALREMGSSAYAITDPQDEIIFHNTGADGTGYKSYESFQSRCEKTISKLILGHSDVIDTVPGKLGSQQGGDASPAQLALNEIEAADTRFMEFVINDHFLDKLRNIGFDIPEGTKFRLLNDKEEQKEKTAAVVFNQAVAMVAKTFADAGYKVGAEWIKKQTEIDIEEKEEPPNIVKPEPMSKDVKNKMDLLYGTGL